MTTYRIASIGGDGVGPEVVAAARTVLDAVVARDGFEIEWLQVVAGGAAIDAYGAAFRSALQVYLSRFNLHGLTNSYPYV